MRDAFGGVFTMNMLLVFIFIFIAFSAISLNYAKAFRVKNAVIDYIEQNEIVDLDDYFSTNFWHGIQDAIGIRTKNPEKLDAILSKLNYNKTCDSLNYQEGKRITTSEGEGYCYKGVLIIEKELEAIQGTKSQAKYYQVVTYADWSLGALNKLLALAGQREDSQSILRGAWQIKGEAKVVEKK